MSALREGFTTGTCAAAAAKAATLALCGRPASEAVEVGLPDGARVRIPLCYAKASADGAEAAVRKDAGDDPDVTRGALVVASASWADGQDVRLEAGDGVGTVTKPGLSVPPGQPAINPVPRRMIRAAVREATDRGIRVVISIPGGQELATKTFNPRLGVVGGLSILGTTGRVRPYSCPALREALKCALSVAAACGIQAPVLVPGHIGERAARKHFRLAAEQVIEVGNEWGFVLDALAEYPFTRLLLLGHPGKLGKLAAGQWDTHSSRSGSALPQVADLAQAVLGHRVTESPTVEGLFMGLSAPDRTRLADALAAKVRESVAGRIRQEIPVSVVLVNMQGEWLGADGDLTAWR